MLKKIKMVRERERERGRLRERMVEGEGERNKEKEREGYNNRSIYSGTVVLAMVIVSTTTRAAVYGLQQTNVLIILHI